MGAGAQEAPLGHPLSHLQYPPPLIPPRGEVNAADAFDIGSFDEEDTKGIKVLGRRGWAAAHVQGGRGPGRGPGADPVPPCQLLESDQELYRNFPLTISERWQQEVTETVFDAVNADTDKLEARKKAKNKQLGHEEGEWGRVLRVSLAASASPWLCPGGPSTDTLSPGAAETDYAMGKDCIMHGYMSKLGNPFLTQWQRRYFYLFPNRLEWRGEGESPVRRAGAGGEQGELCRVQLVGISGGSRQWDVHQQARHCEG